MISSAKAEGQVEKAVQVAKNMLASGLDIETISKFTEIPIEELKKLLNLQ